MPGPADSLPPITARQLSELLDRHAAALALYASQWTSHAEDCVQEALIELAGQPTAPLNPPAWLYRVVRNRALNASRADRRRSTRERAAGVRDDRWRAAGARPTVVDVELMDALTTVDCTSREIIVLRIWGQLAWQEIAQIVGRSKSAAQRDYIAALEQLRKSWDPSSPSPSRDTKPCPTN